MTKQAKSTHKTGTREEWLAARLELLKAEKELTRRQGREKLHYLNPVPIHEIADRWIRPFERSRLEALRDLKAQLER